MRSEPIVPPGHVRGRPVRGMLIGILAAGAFLTGAVGLGISINAGPAHASPADDCAAVRARDHQIYLNLINSLPPGAPIPPEIINPCLTAPTTTATAAPTTTAGLPGMQSPGGGPNVGANAPTDFPQYNGTPIVPVPQTFTPPRPADTENPLAGQERQGNNPTVTAGPAPTAGEASQQEPAETDGSNPEPSVPSSPAANEPHSSDKSGWTDPIRDPALEGYRTELVGFNWDDLNPFNPNADLNPFSDDFCILGHNDDGGCRLGTLGKDIADYVFNGIFRAVVVFGGVAAFLLILIAIFGWAEVAAAFGLSAMTLWAILYGLLNGLGRVVIGGAIAGLAEGFIANGFGALWGAIKGLFGGGGGGDTQGMKPSDPAPEEPQSPQEPAEEIPPPEQTPQPTQPAEPEPEPEPEPEVIPPQQSETPPSAEPEPGAPMPEPTTPAAPQVPAVPPEMRV